MKPTIEVTEATVRAALEAGDLEGAASVIVSAYGREILGFMVARLRSADDAQEAYGIFSEDLWCAVTHVGATRTGYSNALRSSARATRPHCRRTSRFDRRAG